MLKTFAKDEFFELSIKAFNYLDFCPHTNATPKNFLSQANYTYSLAPLPKFEA